MRVAENGPDRGMGWRGIEANEVELSKNGPEAVGSTMAVESGGVEVFAETEAPEIDRKMEEEADSSEWILELEEAGNRAGSGRT